MTKSWNFLYVIQVFIELRIFLMNWSPIAYGEGRLTFFLLLLFCTRPYNFFRYYMVCMTVQFISSGDVADFWVILGKLHRFLSVVAFACACIYTVILERCARNLWWNISVKNIYEWFTKEVTFGGFAVTTFFVVLKQSFS